MPTSSGRPPLPRSADWASPGRSQASPPAPKSARSDAGSRAPEDDGEASHLFDPPPDLVCPITHEVFSDPVLNSAGQVYERSSIEQHLARHNTDPITGTRLASKALTPVYFLKSRAAEWREAAARGCVEQATCIGTPNAIRFVRRAAELCDALASPVLGLSQECLEYIKAHPSNVYDMPALHLFARGLLQSGQRDRAAAVYFTLLQDGADKAQQASLLKQCLACWNVGGPAERSGSVEETVEMLVGCVEASDRLPAADIVDIAQEAALDHAFVARFCEALLFRRRAGGDAAPLSPREWGRQKAVLLKYVQVTCAHMQAQQAAADARVREVTQAAEALQARLEQQQRQQQQQRSSRQAAGPAKAHGGGGGRQRKLVSGVCLAVGCLLPRPELAAVRLLKAASVLALVHFSQ